MKRKPWISIEKPGISNSFFFFVEILGFSHIELEILGISSEMPSISKN